MFLSSITIQGFKSFSKKIVIDLSQNVTGIVGPNGSGKSNVAEAIRFVLGEQSMKGLRSKSGSDLIFKGSTHLPALSRAFVSIHLNNKDKKINEKFLNNSSQINDTLNNFINLDEIILTREIYADGQSEYLINNTKVRLKDVQELLALAQISATGHTIINQGEADKILFSNNKERREIIEEALGLRIYNIRIKESEKKLEKVSQHLKEIDLLRRENLPHLNFLEKTKIKLENREKEIISLSQYLKIYLNRENKEIIKIKEEIENNLNLKTEYNNLSLENIILKLKEKIKNLEIEKENKKENNNINDNLIIETENTILKNIDLEIKELKEKINNLNKEFDLIYKEQISINLEIQFLEKKSNEKLFIKETELKEFENTQDNLWKNGFENFDNQKYIESKNIFLEINNNENYFIKKISGDSKNYEFENIENLKKDFENKKEKLEKINYEKNILEKDLLEKSIQKENLEKEEFEKEKEIIKSQTQNNLSLDNEILSTKLELQKFESLKITNDIKKENLKNKEIQFENILNEMNVLIGHSVLQYKSFNEEKYFEDNLLNEEEKKIISDSLKLNQFELLRKIERSKIKIEETGVVNAIEIIEEYKTLKERDEFLKHEIDDLTKSKASLEILIKDLKDSLLIDFNDGLKKINENFDNYFKEIFEGGKAGLSLITYERKNNDDNDEYEENIEKDGIEIFVNLPQKKIKDLQMLSGGERALTSIALIFAMSSINHPPFIVLDETDAALDESNARKYGKMIQKLSEKSKLLVITHNRETMNRCDVLYGVTIGVDGSSKLLSIKFDDATQYAK